MASYTNGTRDKIMRIRVSEKEYDAIYKRFEESGCRSFSDYVRRVCMQQLIVRYNEVTQKKLLSLVNNLAENMNQIAVAANSTGRVYKEDIEELKGKVDEVWQQQAYIQSLLLKLKP